MRMGKDDIIAEAPLFDQPVPEPSNTGTRIHNNDAIIFGPDLNARRITAVFDVFFPGNRNGTPRTPALDIHLYFTCLPN
jgi:hypothetical protein